MIIRFASITNPWEPTTIVLNPFTGEWRKFVPDFHGLNIDKPYYVFNLALTHAIYFSLDDYTLWDAQTGQDLWRKGEAAATLYPRWSPDGSQAAMVIIQDQNRYPDPDIYLVTKEGQEKRLTNLAEAYSPLYQYYITEMEWSPDGRLIAFQLAIRYMDTFYDNHLFILDVQTGQIFDYCINAEYDLIWGRNSKYLVVNTPTEISELTTGRHITSLDVLLLDLEKKELHKLFADAVAVGWMMNDP